MGVTGALASLVVELSERLRWAADSARLLYPSRAANKRNLTHVDDVKYQRRRRLAHLDRGCTFQTTRPRTPWPCPVEWWESLCDSWWRQVMARMPSPGAV